MNADSAIIEGMLHTVTSMEMIIERSITFATVRPSPDV